MFSAILLCRQLWALGRAAWVTRTQFTPAYTVLPEDCICHSLQFEAAVHSVL